MPYLNQKPRDENGNPNGEWVIYHDNNQIAYRENFINNTFHGLQESYFEDGRLYYRGNYNMGIKVGYWYYESEKRYHLCLI